jgi:hypothetical protein
MSNPCSPPEHIELLGRDGGDTFYASGQEVYRYDGRYYRWFSGLSAWPRTSTAQRIERRHETAAAARAAQQRVKDAIERERQHNRRR